ncbi:LysR family transcriptional regulator [Sansalvadorimonas sp. 2012CJ34-2]|uniref:LysR family transcriptional regulator n=1 Tax=Parendozoicomonas callyspongiae TaxID=2942213 RepID=A0ABT0PD78_9GAMM|nr:LysR family transcriptional regulator [Sansalvadorimonas sp. 2012CJ34-2]MCL6269176.1 LysR family transcriptional regulator [Sansalvadorimonas sp. 2012CJ34-2]
MPLLQLSRINLNLLVCLQALLEEQSVSRAARRLCISQSAVSKHLAQLRKVTNDPLFTRTAHGLNPTTRATKIQQELEPLLNSLLQVVQPEEFNPAKCDHYFRIALPENISHLFFKWCMPEIMKAAPNLTLKVQHLSLENLQELSAGRIDFAVIPHDLECGQDKIAGLHRKQMHQDNLVCLVRNNHPCLSEDWNLETWLELGHINIGSVTSRSCIIDQTLDKHGLSRKIVSAVDNFHSATSACESTDLALISSQLWELCAQEKYEVTALPIPLPTEPVNYQLYWHERNHQSPAHQWFREFALQLSKSSGLKPGVNQIPSSL